MATTRDTLEETVRQNKRVWDETLRDSIMYPIAKATELVIPKGQVFPAKPNKFKQVVMVLNEPLLDIARLASEKGLKPLVVVAGNSNDPIKIVEAGAVGWESDLLRRSNMGAAINSDDHYPLRNNAALYCTDVTVFKNPKYALSRPFKINTLTVAPVSNPRMINISLGNGMVEDYSSEQEKQRMQASINRIFEAALFKGHRAIVVDDFGVSLGNPKEAVIDMFNSALERYPVKYCFFGITDPARPGRPSAGKKQECKSYIAFNKRIKRAH